MTLDASHTDADRPAAESSLSGSDAGHRAARTRRQAACFFEILALTTLVFAQPVFDSMRKNANDVFVHSSATATDIVLLTIIVAFAPALAVWLVGFVAGLFDGLVGRPIRAVVHAVSVGALTGLLAFIVATRQFDLATALRVIVAVVLGLGGALLLYRVVVVRQYLRFLSVAAFVFPVLFLTSEAVSPLVFEPSATAAHVVVTKPHRVVMIVFDELPLMSLLDGHGRIDGSRFPSFAALAGQSTWYRNATTVAPFTELAVPAIASGSYPHHADALPVSTNYPHSLFTLLGRTYRMNVWEYANENICPGSLCSRHFHAERGLGGLLHSARKLWNGVVNPPKTRPSLFNPDDANRGLQQMSGFADSLGRTRKPEVDYLHVLLPHQPWNILPNLQQYPGGRADGLGLGAYWSKAVYAERGKQRHLLQLQATDAMLGRIIAKLRAAGAYDGSLIVVTADHGASFTAGTGQRAPAVDRNYPEILWVPLLVKQPNQSRGAVDDRLSQSIDILPTIADSLGARLPWRVDGRSLLGTPRHDGARRFADLKYRDAFVPPSSPHYRDYDGPAGFRRVLSAAPFRPNGDRNPSLYALPGFDVDIGAPAAPLVAGVVPKVDYIFTNRVDYAHVVRSAERAPWLYLKGALSVAGRRNLVIAVNGRIAGVARTTANYVGGDLFSALLDPASFKAGFNLLRIYELRGEGRGAKLYRIEPVKLTPAKR